MCVSSGCVWLKRENRLAERQQFLLVVVVVVLFENEWNVKIAMQMQMNDLFAEKIKEFHCIRINACDL